MMDRVRGSGERARERTREEVGEHGEGKEKGRGEKKELSGGKERGGARWRAIGRNVFNCFAPSRLLFWRLCLVNVCQAPCHRLRGSFPLGGRGHKGGGVSRFALLSRAVASTISRRGFLRELVLPRRVPLLSLPEEYNVIVSFSFYPSSVGSARRDGFYTRLDARQCVTSLPGRAAMLSHVGQGLFAVNFLVNFPSFSCYAMINTSLFTLPALVTPLVTPLVVVLVN